MGKSCAGKPMVVSQLAAALSSSASLQSSSSHPGRLVGARGRLNLAPVINQDNQVDYWLCVCHCVCVCVWPLCHTHTLAEIV